MKRAISLMLAVCVVLSLGVCGVLADDDVCSQILTAEHMTLDEAWQLIGEDEKPEADEGALQQQIQDLRRCQGRFLQQAEDSGNTYTADVDFYYSNGDVYCTVDYKNYSGDLGDGLVEPSDEEGYLFVSHPKGTFYSQEHDFTIHFGEEQLHIQWADTCDYMLDRGAGDLDATVTRKEKFVESDLYKTMEQTLDEALSTIPHALVYDEQEKTLTIYLELDAEKETLSLIPDSIRTYWVQLTENLVALNEAFYTSLNVGDMFKSSHCDLYVVETLNDDNDYGLDDYLLLLEDGQITYDFLDDNTVPSGGYTSGKQSSSSSGGSYSSSSGSSSYSSSATSGERNALEQAKSYLDFTSFSYSGLIDQLEYEGFTHSEAVYGADHCGADWYEQAVLKAKEYLDFMSFSRSGLIDQLEYEGFTHDQATYAVDKVY